MDMKITIEEVKKIPDKHWENFLKMKYGLDCGGFHFIVGEYADNGFLEMDTYCERLNQTTVVVEKEDYLDVKNGKYKKLLPIDEDELNSMLKELIVENIPVEKKVRKLQKLVHIANKRNGYFCRF
jgi:hypothetical protein